MNVILLRLFHPIYTKITPLESPYGGMNTTLTTPVRGVYVYSQETITEETKLSSV